jgi:uncharacterized protein YjiS (DUF1127 family)
MNKSPINMILANGYAGLAAPGAWSQGWGEHGLGVVRATRHVLELIGGAAVLWLHRSRSRRALLALDEHELCDVGLSRADALREGSKPFWR